MRLQDIDMERKAIHIHKGKGNKDRISILADTTAKHIQEYVAHYRPKYWLFEGQNWEQYCAESLWKIFDSLKTTEIYTHIANKNLLKIKSPIDQLGI